jgi:hypothetical protein
MSRWGRAWWGKNFEKLCPDVFPRRRKFKVFAPRLSLYIFYLLPTMAFSYSADPAVLTRIVTCGDRHPFSSRQFSAAFTRPEGTYYQTGITMSGVSDLLLWANAQSNIESLHMGPFKIEGTTREECNIKIDVDVTDYEQHCACSCAATKTVCLACWPFIQLAMLCLDSALSNSLAVQRAGIHWFWSGNRGVHCFVSDPAWVSNSVEKHRAVAALLEYDQNKPLTADQCALRSTIREFYRNTLQPLHASKLPLDEQLDDRALMAICWPRIDSNVTTGIRHLLRCPFTRNQKSGKYSTLITGDLVSFVPPQLKTA